MRHIVLSLLAAQLLILAMALPGRAQEEDPPTDGFAAANSGKGEMSLHQPTQLNGPSLPEERAVMQQKQADAQNAKAVVPRDLLAERTTEALAEAAKLPPESVVHLTVYVDAAPLDPGTLRHAANETARGNAIENFKQSVRGQANALVSAVAAAGGSVVETNFLGPPQITISVPAGKIPTIVTQPKVRGVEWWTEGGKPSVFWGLRYGTGETLVKSLRDNAGFDGANGGNAGGRVRIGIIEHGSSCPNSTNYVTNHPAFNDSYGVGYRVQRIRDCSSGTCVTHAAGTADVHGNEVSGIAAQDLLDGQDPSIPVGNERDRRTGMSPESWLFYYNAGCDYGGVNTAINAAVADQVDIINMSFQFESCQDVDHNGINASLAAARQSNILLVAAAGNIDFNLTDPCGITYPASRPDVLAVNALNTTDENRHYPNVSLQPGAFAVGNFPAHTLSGVNTTLSAIGLAAPGCYRLYVSGNASYEPNGACGTSFAAPTVSGAAADLRSYWTSYGWLWSGGLAFVNMLISGDSWNGQDYGSGGYGFTISRASSLGGFGRLRMRAPSDAVITAPWYWYTNFQLMHTGDHVQFDIWDSGPEPAGITEMKIVTATFDQSLSSIADVDVYVTDTCPAPGGSTLVAQQTDFDTRNHITLSGSQVSGHCLHVNINGYNMPAAGQNVYWAVMYHSTGP